MTEELLKQLSEAQMVLVGIGREMEAETDEMEKNPFYASLLHQAEASMPDARERLAVKQYLRLHYLRHHRDTARLNAYEQLAGMLAGKNYFLVSLCTDDLIFETDLNRDRIVTPCGGYRALQCMETDSEGNPLCVTDQEPLVTDERVWNQTLEEIDRCGGDLSRVDFPVCAECCHMLAFNQIGTPGYREEGYLPWWEKYMRWLQGTLNHRVCVLELGVGMEYPGVIRFPFEKVVFFNQKASFFRVHSRLWQMTEELKDRGISIKENPVSCLNSGMLSPKAAGGEET